MKKFLLILAVAVTILFSTASCLIVTTNSDGHIVIENETISYYIENVFIRESGDSQLGSDQLGSDTIGPGDSHSFEVHPNTYDVTIVDDWGDSYSAFDVYVPSGTSVYLSYDGFDLY